METLAIVFAAIVIYLTIWTYFDACRWRDAYQIGLGPRNLPPNTWSALVFFLLPIAAPLYLRARDRVVLEANARSGAPPVFESRGLNLYGWIFLLLFLAGGGYLLWEKEFLLAALALVLAGVAVFGGRTIVATDRALRVDLPKGAAWEQVGFRPLPREEDQADEDPEERVVNLDRLPPVAASRPPAAPYSPAAPAYPAAAAPVYPAAPAPPPAPPFPAIPSVSSFPPPPPPRPAPPASPATSQQSLRISDITWAASEDGYDDGSASPPSRDPRATVALADPAVFQQLGGIFAPPSADAPPRFPLAPPPAAPAAPPAPPAPLAKPPAATPLPAPAAPARPSAPPPPAPLAAPLVPPPPASPRPPGPAAGKTRPAPPIAGAYAASSAGESKLPQILIAGIALALMAAAGLYVASNRNKTPATSAPPPENAPAPETTPAPAPSPAPNADAPAPASDPNAGESATTATPADAAATQQEAAKAWMAQYFALLGPVGQSLEEIDFDGFSPDRCALLRQNLERTAELGPLPDEQLNFQMTACVQSLPDLATDCEQRDLAAWCFHLISARRCLHEAQLAIESQWGVPGLLEFQISESEPRSTSSMTGRCLAEEERRNATPRNP